MLQHWVSRIETLLIWSVDLSWWNVYTINIGQI